MHIINTYYLHPMAYATQDSEVWTAAGSTGMPLWHWSNHEVKSITRERDGSSRRPAGYIALEHRGQLWMPRQEKGNAWCKTMCLTKRYACFGDSGGDWELVLHERRHRGTSRTLGGVGSCARCRWGRGIGLRPSWSRSRRWRRRRTRRRPCRYWSTLVGSASSSAATTPKTARGTLSPCI
jgi:hypothetical protein